MFARSARSRHVASDGTLRTALKVDRLFVEGNANDLLDTEHNQATVQVEATAHGRNIRLWEELLPTLKVTHTIKTASQITQKSLEELIGHRAGKRRIKYLRYGHSEHTDKNGRKLRYWRINIQNNTPGEALWGGKTGKSKGLEYLINRDVVPETHVARVANSYIKMLEGFPGPIGPRQNDAVKRRMIDVAMLIHCPNFQRETLQPWASNRSGHPTWGTGPYLIDLDTGEFHRHQIEVLPSDIRQPIPDISSVSKHWKMAEPSDAIKRTIEFFPTNEQQAHRNAIYVCALIFAELDGKLVKKDCMDALVSLTVQKYLTGAGTKKERDSHLHHHARGVYNGKPLLSVAPFYQLGYSMIRLSSAPMAHVDEKSEWPKIKIFTTLPVRLAGIYDLLERTFEASGNLLDTWYAGCRYADTANEDISQGILPKLSCHCESKEKALVYHRCHGCLARTPCSHLRDQANGSRLCESCDKRQLKDDATDPHNPKDGLRKRLTTAYRVPLSNEMRQRGLSIRDPMVQQQGLLDVNPAFNRHISGNHPNVYRDGYQQTTVLRFFAEQQTDKSWRFAPRNPFTPSVEAVWPFVEVGKFNFIHHPNNIIVVPFFVNLTKHIFVPCVLAVLRQHLANPAKRSEADLAQRTIGFMRHIWFLALVTGSKRSRLLNKVSLPQGQRLKTEWRHGRLIDREPPPEAKRYCQNISPPSPNWKPDCYNTFVPLVEAIEKRFSIKFPRSKDGAPYPFHKDARPPDWSWWKAWCLFSERAHRMFWWCNGMSRFLLQENPLLTNIGKWVQCDNTITIYLECLWQAADKVNFKEFFGLPMVVWSKHPLRFVVAHNRHGQQMRTGWITLNPTTIFDRDQKLCNILIETHISNMAKLDWDPSLYPKIKEYFTNFNLHQDYWTPDELTNAEKKALAPPPKIAYVEEEQQLEDHATMISAFDATDTTELDFDKIDTEGPALKFSAPNEPPISLSESPSPEGTPFSWSASPTPTLPWSASPTPTPMPVQRRVVYDSEEGSPSPYR